MSVTLSPGLLRDPPESVEIKDLDLAAATRYDPPSLELREAPADKGAPGGRFRGKALMCSLKYIVGGKPDQDARQPGIEAGQSDLFDQLLVIGEPLRDSPEHIGTKTRVIREQTLERAVR